MLVLFQGFSLKLLPWFEPSRFHEQLAEQGYVARAGQMIDATFVEVPKQRNTRYVINIRFE